MPQPPQVDAAAQRLIDVYRAAQQSLEAQIVDVVDGPDRRRQVRLRELLRAVDRELLAVEAATATWLTAELPAVYAVGATAAADLVGSRFVWTQLHTEAVQAIADRTYKDLLGKTRFMRTETKGLLRRLVADPTRRALLEGITPTRAAADLAGALRTDTGLLTIRYSNGARHSVSDWADTAIRSESATAHNEGTFVQAEGDGFDLMECFDGPDCGLRSHEDPEKADGRVYPIEVAREHPIAHPRCARSWAPAVDAADTAGASRFTPAEQTARAAAERARAAAAPPRFTVGQENRRAARQARTGRSARTPRQPASSV